MLPSGSFTSLCKALHCLPNSIECKALLLARIALLRATGTLIYSLTPGVLPLSLITCGSPPSLPHHFVSFTPPKIYLKLHDTWETPHPATSHFPHHSHFKKFLSEPPL
ncbi:hypothetical protein FKM82_021643 [Ascaphus truei]